MTRPQVGLLGGSGPLKSQPVDWADLFPPGLLPSLSGLLRRGAEAAGQGACFVLFSVSFQIFPLPMYKLSIFLMGTV